MLQELYCKNYKAFGESTRFPLTPLTVLVGPNNAGKSSVIDLVRLATRNKGTVLHRLSIPGTNERLRSFEALIHKQSEESESRTESLEIGVRTSADQRLQIGSDGPTLHLEDDISLRSKFKSFGDGYFPERRDVFLHPTGNRDPSARKRMVTKIHEIGSIEEEEVSPGTPIEDTAFSELMEDDSGEDPDSSEELWIGMPWKEGEQFVRNVASRSSSGSDTILIGGPTGPYKRDVTQTFELTQDFFALVLGVINELQEKGSNKPLRGVSAGFINFKTRKTERVNSKQDVPALRFIPFDERIPHLDSPTWAPPELDEIWDALRTLLVKPLGKKISRPFGSLGLGSTYISSFRASPKHYYGPNDELTPLLKSYRDTHPIKQEQVQKWLATFEIGSDLQVEKVGPELYSGTIERNGARRSLADLGSGAAQLLPLILKPVSGKTSDVLLLEEPEANLHPDLQARLADLLIELMQEGHQILVETHSEYLVRRLQYLVATGECAPKHTSVLYLDARSKGEGAPDVRNISIDDYGQLSEPLGSGFFDQATDLMVDLFEYGSEN